MCVRARDIPSLLVATPHLFAANNKNTQIDRNVRAICDYFVWILVRVAIH